MHNLQDFGTQTIPPPRAIFTGQVNQWVIFDAYQEDYAVQQKEKDKDKKEKPVTGGIVKKEETKKKEVQSSDVTSRMLMAAKILERMVNQNTFDEIAQGIVLRCSHIILENCIQAVSITVH